MARSPFPANATLTFQMPVAGTRAIARSGNPSVQTTELVVKAFMKQDKGRSRTDDELMMERVDRTSVKGAFVEPLALPVSIKDGAQAKVVVKDPAGIQPDVVATFILEVLLPSPYGTTATVGQKFKGYLTNVLVQGERR